MFRRVGTFREAYHRGGPPPAATRVAAPPRAHPEFDSVPDSFPALGGTCRLVEFRALDRSLPAVRHHPGGLPAGRLPGAAARAAAGGGRDDHRRAARALALRPAGARTARPALSQGEPADHLQPRPDRTGALHVPDRPRVRPRAHPQADEERDLRLLGRHRHAVRAGRAPRLGPDGPLPALRSRREGLGGGALHGLGDVDHRLPDAGADHLGARPLGHRAGNARARRRLARRRGGLVPAGGRAGELHRQDVDRAAGALRRSVLRPVHVHPRAQAPGEALRAGSWRCRRASRWSCRPPSPCS